MADHPVKRKLARDVMPYLVSSRRLERQWFYILHGVFGFTTDVVVLLAGLGVATPLITLIGGLSKTETEAGDAKPPGLLTVLNSVPSWLTIPAAVLIGLWIVLRVAFVREEGQKRAVLARSCARTLRLAEAELAKHLGQKDPLPALSGLVNTKIVPTVDRAIQEDAWPWTPFAPGIDPDVVEEVGALCAKFEEDWDPAPAGEQREPPAAPEKVKHP